MLEAGKLLVGIGAACIVLGLILWAAGRFGFRGMPGDVHIQSEQVRFYFPVVTCLLVSALLTLALWAWQWLTRK